jgi:hypothetical protein
MTAETFKFEGGPVLQISGDGQARRHFAAEYREALTHAALTPDLAIAFKRGDDGLSGGSSSIGGHKTMHWRTRLCAPGSSALDAAIDLSGWPRSFGLSLVQGYFVEPLLSIAAARSGAVLLPAAAFEVDGKALVVVGLSGSGKTSLSMQAMAMGLPVLGDDQILLTPDGMCRAFPRRLRLYPDLRSRVPIAYKRLPKSAKAQLHVRRVVRSVSRGWLAPSFALTRGNLGQDGLPEPKPVGGIILLVRSELPGEPKQVKATTGEAIDYGIAALREQRRHLAACGEAWSACVGETERIEAGLLGHAFACAPASKVVVPTPFGSRQLLELGRSLGMSGIVSPVSKAALP